ncbi:DnaD domain protein [Spiroplasma culicicola]|uniref:Chromosome replication initiation and membrane attachment protein n=1 Tax=Spiroplasma culicicola AES-1 TaxID=1276246 RepID=W6AHQ6_9MOLU|nr:DnaD domain protein [Spiroplasma culicicola]AHI53214.1 chromosome replication initiation and membrane attachment protein [Spiroplasma culicicola AES-1]
MKNFVYKVIIKNSISSFDDKILAYLYQPIIGMRSVNLYKLLIHEAEILKDLKTAEFKEERILTLCDLKHDKMSKWIKRLEAMGLIETLYNQEKNSVIYNIYAPLEPKAFFENELFNNALMKKIDEKNYEIARFIFRDEGDFSQTSGYNNTSSKFFEVFAELSENSEIKFTKGLKPKPKRSSPLLKGFNFENLMVQLEREQIIITNNIDSLKEELQNVYCAYSVSQDEILKALKAAYDGQTYKISKNKFYNYISEVYFGDEAFQTTVDVFDPKQNMIEQTNIKLKELETIEPVDYLQGLLRINKLNDDMILLIKKLSSEYKLRHGVINCLMDFSYFKNDEKIVANYLYKIAKTFQDKSIKTAKEAMEYLKAANQKSKKPKNTVNSFDFINDDSWSKTVKKKTYEVETKADAKLDESLWGDN